MRRFASAPFAQALHPLSEGGDNLKNAHLRRLATGASQSHGQRKKSFILLVKSAGRLRAKRVSDAQPDVGPRLLKDDVELRRIMLQPEAKDVEFR